MYAFLLCGWIETVNPALITYQSHVPSHLARSQFFLVTRDKSKYGSLSVLESGNQKPSKLRLSAFLTSHTKSYEQMILKNLGLEQVIEPWCVNLLQLQLQLYSPSLRKCRKSYGQMILKNLELEQVIELWCVNLLQLRLQLYSPSLRKCSMVVQHGEAMQWFLCLRRRPCSIFTKPFLISVCFKHQLHCLRYRFL